MMDPAEERGVDLLPLRCTFCCLTSSVPYSIKRERDALTAWICAVFVSFPFLLLDGRKKRTKTFTDTAMEWNGFQCWTGEQLHVSLVSSLLLCTLKLSFCTSARRVAVSGRDSNKWEKGNRTDNVRDGTN